jgi:hypothetical protein
MVHHHHSRATSLPPPPAGVGAAPVVSRSALVSVLVNHHLRFEVLVVVVAVPATLEVRERRPLHERHLLNTRTHEQEPAQLFGCVLHSVLVISVQCVSVLSCICLCSPAPVLHAHQDNSSSSLQTVPLF